MARPPPYRPNSAGDEVVDGDCVGLVPGCGLGLFGCGFAGFSADRWLCLPPSTGPETYDADGCVLVSHARRAVVSRRARRRQVFVGYQRDMTDVAIVEVDASGQMSQSAVA